jgi:hypothetical protein
VQVIGFESASPSQSALSRYGTALFSAMELKYHASGEIGERASSGIEPLPLQHRPKDRMWDSHPRTQESQMFRKTLLTIAALAALGTAALTSTSASAGCYGYNSYDYGNSYSYSYNYHPYRYHSYSYGY